MTAIEELERLHGLTLKYFRTAPSKVNSVFSAAEIAILKQAGIIRRPGRKVSVEDAAIYGAAYTALSR